MREFAVRAALGAGKSRLIRQLSPKAFCSEFSAARLVSSSPVGGRALRWTRCRTLCRALRKSALTCTCCFSPLATALLAGILFGLFPALKISRANLQDNFKEGGRGGSGSRQRVHGVLVVVEMSLALVLLIGAGLALRTLVQLWNVDPGFKSAQRLDLRLLAFAVRVADQPGRNSRVVPRSRRR